MTPVTQYKYDVDDFFDVEIADENHSVEHLDTMSLRTSCHLRCKRLLVTDEHLLRRKQKCNSEVRRASTELGVVSDGTAGAGGRTPPRSKSESAYLSNRCPIDTDTLTTISQAPVLPDDGIGCDSPFSKEYDTSSRNGGYNPAEETRRIADRSTVIAPTKNHPSSKYAVTTEYQVPGFTNEHVSPSREITQQPVVRKKPKTAEFSFQLSEDCPETTRVQTTTKTNSQLVNTQNSLDRRSPTHYTTTKHFNLADQHNATVKTSQLTKQINLQFEERSNKVSAISQEESSLVKSPLNSHIPIAIVEPCNSIDSQLNDTLLSTHDSENATTTTVLSISRDSGVFTNNSPSAVSSTRMEFTTGPSNHPQVAIAEVYSDDDFEDDSSTRDSRRLPSHRVDENEIIFQMLEESNDSPGTNAESFKEEECLNELWTVSTEKQYII